ncbi:unnamed protein product [Withania somnifera]
MADSEFPDSYASTPNINHSETLFHKRRRCFCFPSFNSTNQLTTSVNLNWWRRFRYEGSVWSKGINALKKLREWSEIVAGPRWKTFIRRFNRNKSGSRNAKFQYDPSKEEEELVLRNFSTRYASIPASGKVSMGHGPSSV